MGILTVKLNHSQACIEFGHTSRDLSAYLKAEWIFPFSRKSKASGFWHVFDSFRSRSSKEAERLKASASEILGIYSVVRHWVATVVGPRPELANQRASFDAACATVDILIQTKKGMLDNRRASDMLLEAIGRHQRLHIAAYGVDKIKPKHNWMFDVAEMLQHTEAVLDAFIIERLHLRVKRQADAVKDMNVYEAATTASVINEQFEDAKRQMADGLLGRHHAYHGARVSDHMLVGSTTYSTSDVVARHTQMGVVALCAEEDGLLVAIVRELAPISQANARNCLVKPIFMTTLKRFETNS